MRRPTPDLLAGMACAAVSILLSQPAAAQDGTALRVEGFAGAARDDQRPLAPRDTDFSGGVLPSVTLDLGVATIQFDGMAAEHLGKTMLAGAGHVAVKPSEQVSVGVYAAYARLKDVGGLDTYRVGAEAAYHGSNFSLSGVAGYEHTERRTLVVGTVPGFIVADTYGRGGQFFSMADVTFYPDQNFSLSAGHRYVGSRHAAALGAEKAFGPIAAFAEGRIGQENYKAIWAGLRIRFGSRGGSLQSREQAGFADRLKDELFVNGNARRRGQAPIIVPPPPPPPPPPGDGCGCGAGYCGQ